MHPYGRTLQQELAVAGSIPSSLPSADEAEPPPLLEQPRKLVLLFLLRSLGSTGQAGAIPLLRWALRSEDRDLRLAAARSLGRFYGADVDATLRALLADPANGVRAAAAEALLERLPAAASGGEGLWRKQLLAHRWI